MTDPEGIRIAGSSMAAASQANPAAPKLRLITARKPGRDGMARAGANLPGILAQLVELQQRFAVQMETLEEGIQEQRRELINARGRLPEMKDKINWLIAGHYGQGETEVALREKVGRHETAIQKLAQAVQSLCETEARWQAILIQWAGAREPAGSAPAAPPPETAI